MVSFKNSWLSRVGIVVIAAIMVETISIIQYEQSKSVMKEELETRTYLGLRLLVHDIEHTLSVPEATMREHLWDIKRCMSHPDSLFPAMVRLIENDPYVVGGCIAFKPDYYPSKGRLFEPYATKKADGAIDVQQIAGPDHDYTQNEEYVWVLEHRCPSWTDPYTYGPESFEYATYLYPIMDDGGKIVAVCGLDIDLTWLGDTMNDTQPYPSSFVLLLTQEGDLVTGPDAKRASPEIIDYVVDILNGDKPSSAGKNLLFRKTALSKDPYWQLVQVYFTKEVFARMNRQRLQHALFVILGLAILAFMIERYSRNEKNLRHASEVQARIGSELSIAHRIQLEMLPKSFPPFVYAKLEPARAVGGDIYDFFIRDGKFFFCIGDVSGKGVPSAMLMSVVHSAFRMIIQKEDSPSKILEALNLQLCNGNDTNMFMTFFVGCLDLYSGEFHFGNAGHDRPFILGQEISLLQAKSNLPLGVFPHTHFEEESCVLPFGTTLLLYTDGLTEAKNVERQIFGRARIEQVLHTFVSGQDHTLSSLVNILSSSAHTFAGEEPQSDDLTILALRFAPENLLREKFTLVNSLSEVPRLGIFVKDFLSQLDFDKKPASGIRLAVEEIVVNVINYAYPEGTSGDILLEADSNGQEVRFIISDTGIPFDPTSVMEPDTTLDANNRPIGGLGIHLARKLMDSISYTRRKGKNVLSLTKSIL